MTAATSPTDTRENAAPPLHVDRGVAIKSILALWAFYFVLNTARMAIETEPGQLEMMGLRSGVTLAGIAITFVMYLILRHLEARSMRFMVTTALLISIPATAIYATINYAAFYMVAPPDILVQEIAQLHSEHGGAVSVLLDLAVSWYFFIVSWCVLYVALSYAARVGQAERSAAAYRLQAQAAQLRALRYQINPHFLFNTLNALSALVLRQRTREAEAMITNLATFFRSSLTGDPAADVALSDEIDMQRLYLEIERVRFPERLSVLMDVPEALQNARVPGMILQPLVENAIRHGVARSSKPVTLAIRAWAENGFIHLVVEDDAQSGGDISRGVGVGLKNVSDRLAARFDGAARAVHGPRDGGGFRVSLVMPMLSDG
ncbi:MAG TPA: histidine kinase [Rhizomicrobium sp.]|nr:histidine kinase [Rhizomicrobium sp.]